MIAEFIYSAVDNPTVWIHTFSYQKRVGGLNQIFIGIIFVPKLIEHDFSLADAFHTHT